MSILRRITYALAALHWILTSLYGAIAAQPFVQEQFLGPGLFPPLTLFADSHSLIGLALLTVWAAARWSAPGRHVRRDAAVAGAWITVTCIIAWATPLSKPLSPEAAFAVGAIAAAVVMLVAVAEWPTLADAGDRSDDRSFSDLAAFGLAAVSAVSVHTVAAAWIDRTVAMPLSDVGWSLRLHLLLAGGAFLVTAIIRAAAALTRRPPAVERALAVAALAATLSLLVFFVVFASISVRGPLALGLAVAIGLAVALAACTSPRHVSIGNDGVRSAFEAWSPRIAGAWWGFLMSLLALCVLAVVFSALSRLGDWNFVLARTGIVVTWLLTLGVALRLTRGMRSGGALAAIAATAVLLVGHLTLAPDLSARAAPLRDPAARWLADALDRPAVPAGDADLAAFLHAHTNIPRDVTVAPVEVRPSSFSGAPSRSKPHVFVFVIDSVRRDYLSPYNPAVTFTPAVHALAHDSLVFRNAFTQYGATGLSVPALWVGGLLLHKQYVTPFAPMNSLARLLAHEHYAQWIGMDNIMQVILPPSSQRIRLDEGVAIKDFRLCPTLAVIRAHLDARAADAAPVFVYSLPQDVHVAAVAREGGAAIDRRAYPGFYAPVASRMARIDACLGEFVAALKSRGLYEQSIIVLTSDHGDSLGEEGRMGHAYSLHPEIVRVPLVVHVPHALRSRWQWDESRVAFTTDLTPTLYRLLGHAWHAPASFFGEPLMRDPGTAPPPPRDRMVAASYGAVYGAVLDGGARYYVYDAITMRDMAFSLDEGPQPGEPATVTASLRAEGTAVIRRTVEDIAAFYHFRPDAR
jgi:hypothetical protein